MRDRKLAELQEWRRGCGVLWVSEMLRADGRTPRQRYTAALRVASGGADLARLRRILFGSGRIEAGPTRRVGYPASEAWTAIRVGDWVWRGSAPLRVCSVRSGSVGARSSARCCSDAGISYVPAWRNR